MPPQKRAAPGEKLRTAVRQLQPNELFALTAENDRLVKLEKDLAEREAAVSRREQQGQDSIEEATRLAAQNDELRRALDLSMLNAGDGGAAAAEAGDLRRQLRELEARRVLEKSEEAARLERMRLAMEESKEAHDATSAKLRTMQAAHEHATQLLRDLQAAHDECSAGRSSAERERDRLAELLARKMREVGEAGATSEGPAIHADILALELRENEADLAAASACDSVHRQLLAAELRRQETAVDEAVAAGVAALGRAMADAETAHAAELDRRAIEMARAVEEALVESQGAEAGARVMRAEVAALEDDAASLARRESEARGAAEAAEAEAARLRAAWQKEQRARERADMRATRLQASVDELGKQLEAAAAAVAKADAALADQARLEAELAAARHEAARSAEEVSRLQNDATEREKAHEAAMQALREQQREAGRLRESVLREAVNREKACRQEMNELREQAESSAADEQAAREGEELALGQVARLEKQLAVARKEITRQDDRLKVLQRRLDVLAATTTESNMHDMGYWMERGKRTDFAAQALTVGTSKKAAKAIAAAAMRGNVIGAQSRPLPTSARRDATNTVEKLPPLTVS